MKVFYSLEQKMANKQKKLLMALKEEKNINREILIQFLLTMVKQCQQTDEKNIKKIII